MAAAPPSTSKAHGAFYDMSSHFLRSAIVVLAFALALGRLTPSSASEIGADGVHHVGAVEAAELITQDPDIIILDVRTPREFNEGHIERAVNIDYYSSNFKDLLEDLDPTTTYLLHCRTGARSGRTLPLMLNIGFQNIHHLKGGIESWKEAGLPVSIK